MSETPFNSPLIIAHRGDSANAPENTLAAFRMALAKGADGLEFDVQLSRDGVPVVIHDHDLKRTGIRPERVAELTAAELGKINVGSWFNSKYPKLADPGFAEEFVPTLVSVLENTISCEGPIYVELKCEGSEYAELVTRVCEVLRNFGGLERLIVKSFRLAAIPLVRTLLPEVQTAALFAPEAMNFLRRRRHIIDLALQIGAHQLSLHRMLASARLLKHANEAGIPVTIWTADRPKWVDRCRKRGIRSLITNDPGKQLERRGQVTAGQ